MDMMRRSTLSVPLTMEFIKPNWLKLIPQISPDTYYSPRCLIPQFPPERIMVNVLLDTSVLCGANQRNLGCGVVMGAIFPERAAFGHQMGFSLIFGYFLSFSLVFSLAATHPKYTPGSLPILAHTQRDVRAAAKPEADSRTLKSLAILDKNRVR